MSDLVVRRKSRTLLYSIAFTAALMLAPLSAPAFEPTQVYQPITETLADRTVTLTGRDLTIEQVVDMCRYQNKPPVISRELLDAACASYFLEESESQAGESRESQ